MKMLRVLAVGMALAASLAVSGCGDDGDEGSDGSPVNAEDLATGTYNSTSVTGHELVSGTTVKLAFESGVMSVSAGCNAMGSDFAVDGGKLAWSGEPNSTMMACSDELTAQDDWLRQAFSDGWDATVDGSTLTLTQGDVTMDLEMQE